MFYHQQTNSLIIDTQHIIAKALVGMVDDLTSLGLIEIDNIIINLKDVDQRNVLYHHIIIGICEAVVNCEHNGYKVLYCRIQNKYDMEKIVGVELTFDNESLNKTIIKILSGISKYLPLMFYHGSISYGELCRLLTENRTGESIVHVIKILDMINSFDPSNYRFDKLKNYIRKYRLNFLSEEYFSQFKTKKLWYIR